MYRLAQAIPAITVSFTKIPHEQHEPHDALNEKRLIPRPVPKDIQALDPKRSEQPQRRPR
jgi:hypothetical protein